MPITNKGMSVVDGTALNQLHEASVHQRKQTKGSQYSQRRTTVNQCKEKPVQRENDCMGS